MFLWKALVGWLRRGNLPLIETDARSLIEERGIQAYGIARWRARQIRHGQLVDESRPPGHWDAVSRRIAELVGHRIGADSATRREHRD